MRVHSSVDDPDEAATDREPRVLVAPVRVTEHHPDRVTGRMTITPDEPVFQGHYPGLPVLPGVCELEAAVVTGVTGRLFQGPVRLASVASARFHRPVLPNQHLTIDVRRSPNRGPGDCLARLRTEEGKSATIRLRYERRHIDERTPDEWPSVFLPHRYPMLLVDRVLEYAASERIVATKAITRSEPWYQQVSPASGRSVGYPRVLVLESWCQTATLLAVGFPTSRQSEPPRILFGAMTGVDWHGDAFPGDVVTHEAVLVRSAGEIFYFEGKSSIGENIVLTVKEVTVVVRRASEDTVI